jgi:hypothetical protein
MDRDDAGMSDRSDEAHQGDTGMIGSESEDPGPGRDTSLTDPDPVAASTDQPRGTVAMSEGDPMRTRLGSHVEGAGVIGYDVAASEEGATEETPAADRPGYEPERSAGEASVASAAVPGTSTGYERDPGLAAEPVVDQESYERDAGLTGTPPGDQSSYEREAGPGVAAAADRVEDVRPSGGSVFDEGPPPDDRSAFATEDAGGDRTAVTQDPAAYGAGDARSDAPATYTGEEEDVTGRPEFADRAEGGDQPRYQEETQRLDRPGGGGSLFTDEEPELLDRPGPQEPGVQEGIYDQEADQARQQRPSDGR